jgi:hypothetical protein
MKKLTSCFFLVYFLSHLLFAQNDSVVKIKTAAKRNIMKVFYFGPGAGGYNLAFERIIKRKISIQMGIRYIRFKGGVFSYNSYKDFYLKPEIRYYLSKKNPPKGIYIGVTTHLEFLKVVYLFSPPQNSVDKEILNGFYLGEELHIGYQWLIKRRISIDVNAGVRYMNRIGPVNVTDHNNDGTVTKTKNHFDESAGYFTPVSLLPSFSFMIGFAF